jgi:hypothetical protein
MPRIALAAWVVLVGCSGTIDGPAGRPGDQQALVFKTPQLETIAPTQVALGDQIQVIGKDFLDAKRGTMALHMFGTFTDSDGNQNPYDDYVNLTYDTPGRASFEFGPKVIFARTGDKLGTFNGSVELVARLTGPDGSAQDERRSTAMPTGIQVMPSLMIEQFHSTDDSCEEVTTGTVANAKLAMRLRAIGLAPTSATSPITFEVNFTSPIIRADYDHYSLRTGDQTWSSQIGQNGFSLQIVTGDAITIDPRSPIAVQPQPLPAGGSDASDITLVGLAAGPVDDGQNAAAPFSLSATDGQGQQVRRAFNLKVWSPVASGSRTSRNVHYWAPDSAGCNTAGDYPTEVSYMEGTSDSRTRSVSFKWDSQASRGGHVTGSVEYKPGVIIGVSASATYDQSWANTFGTDSSVQVSSSKDMHRSIQQQVPPRRSAVFYRRAVQVEREVPILLHNACGVEVSLGSAILTDWYWDFEIQQGPSCSPPAPSSFKEMVCPEGC